MSNNDQGSQGIRDVVQAEVHFLLAWLFISECWTLKMKALHTFKTLQTACSTRQHHMPKDLNLKHTTVRTSNLPSYSFLI